ncbi:MAG: hypothetical protein JW734_09150 [Candidatus Omnitrophica bacterium]|nr:hypothetical protein [Candidatus Omnitrophota bacterium]
MVGLVKLMGIIMVGYGIAYLVKPSVARKIIRFWEKKKRLYWGGVLSILIGIVFLMAAPYCGVSWYVILMGILALVKGVVIFVAKDKEILSWMDKVAKLEAKNLRLLSLITVGLGVLLIYSV